MDKKIATIIIGFVLVAPFAACSSRPSEQDIQTAIAETHEANPTSTSTPRIESENVQEYIDNMFDAMLDCQTALLDAAVATEMLSIDPYFMLTDSWKNDMRTVAIDLNRCADKMENINDIPSGMDAVHSKALDVASEIHTAMGYQSSSIDYIERGDFENALENTTLMSEHMIALGDKLFDLGDAFGDHTEKIIPLSPIEINPIILTPQPTYTPIPTKTPVPTATPLPAGSVINMKGWQVQVVRVEILDEIVFYDQVRRAEGRLALLFLSVTNIGTQTESFIGTHGFVDIVDANSRRFEEDSVASFEAQVMYNQEMEGSSIDPGETRNVIVVYDISEQSDYYLLVPGILAGEFSGKVLLDVP